MSELRILRKRPNPRFYYRNSLSFSAEEIALMTAGEIDVIQIFTPANVLWGEITNFDNLLSSVTCKGEYYVAQYKTSDVDYRYDQQ